jgi:hypothetical protein
MVAARVDGDHAELGMAVSSESETAAGASCADHCLGIRVMGGVWREQFVVLSEDRDAGRHLYGDDQSDFWQLESQYNFDGHHPMSSTKRDTRKKALP